LEHARGNRQPEEKNVTLNPHQQEDLLKRGFSRRHFGKLASFLAAGSTLPFYNEAALAQLSQVRGAPPDAVMINANENPLGPCAEAAEAMHNMIAQGGRYNYGSAEDFSSTLAEQEGLKANYVQAFAGSSAPLHQSVLAFTSPAKPFVMGDPGYESGANAARVVGAKVIKVPLTKTYAHDVKAMAAADPSAGLIYISNPNNPSGTLTPAEDIAWLVKNKPAGCILMIDEAYTHISGAPFSTEFVARDEDVIILRTFSKIYGMAGLRAGAALAKPEILARITQWSSGALPVTGMVGAIVSLKVKNLVPERRKIIGDVRNDVFAFMDKNNFKYVPSVSNKFMAETGRPYDDVIMALRREKVYIGRGWPVWPTHVRVSIGTQEEMDKFKAAYLKVMQA
jgi:histidinol-phosphate/aromatic aminotransferase/cobyric acid decarboxylase-like protein